MKRFELHAVSPPAKLPGMHCADNSPPLQSRRIVPAAARRSLIFLSLLILFFCFSGCDQVSGSRYAQLVQDAEQKSAQGDFERAIDLYEAALDDSENTRKAEVHYKLALLYDDKLHDPVSALHHFKRYLALSQNGPHARDAANSIKRDEIAALTSLSGDSVITRAEAARLRNENLMLHKELETRAAARTALDKSQAADTRKGSKKAAQTYVVKSGDTLFSISRKFYDSPKRWKQILDANKKNVRDPKDLTVGQTLVIP